MSEDRPWAWRRLEEDVTLIQLYYFPISDRAGFMCLLLPVSLNSWEAAWKCGQACLQGYGCWFCSVAPGVWVRPAKCVGQICENFFWMKLTTAWSRLWIRWCWLFFFFLMKNWPSFYIGKKKVHYEKGKHFKLKEKQMVWKPRSFMCSFHPEGGLERPSPSRVQ